MVFPESISRVGSRFLFSGIQEFALTEISALYTRLNRNKEVEEPQPPVVSKTMPAQTSPTAANAAEPGPAATEANPRGHHGRGRRACMIVGIILCFTLFLLGVRVGMEVAARSTV